MKTLKILPVLFIFTLTSCSSVRVATDYDRDADFNSHQTIPFYKPVIDKAKISHLNKKRILRAIDAQLSSKGMSKSESPDLLVSILLKKKNVLKYITIILDLVGDGILGVLENLILPKFLVELKEL